MIEPLVASAIALQAGTDDGSPVMMMEFKNDAGDVIAKFHMNTQTAEAICITLALWSRHYGPGQTAPTSNTLQ